MISSVVEKSRFQSFFKYFSQEATFFQSGYEVQQVEIKPDKYRMTGQTSTVQAPCHSANTSSRRLKRKKFPPTSCPKRVLQLLIPKRSPSEPEGGGEVIRFLGSVQVMERKGTAGECVCVCARVCGAAMGCQIWRGETTKHESVWTGKSCSGSLLLSADVGLVLCFQPNKKNEKTRMFKSHHQLGHSGHWSGFLIWGRDREEAYIILDN